MCATPLVENAAHATSLVTLPHLGLDAVRAGVLGKQRRQWPLAVELRPTRIS
jgi:hypothetical protein